MVSLYFSLAGVVFVCYLFTLAEIRDARDKIIAAIEDLKEKP